MKPYFDLFRRQGSFGDPLCPPAARAAYCGLHESLSPYLSGLDVQRREIFLRELEFLRRETDPGLFLQAVLKMGSRAQLLEERALAAAIFAWVSEHADGQEREAATQSLLVLEGGGGFGARAEHLLQSFAKQAGDPATLAAMAAGGMVYRTTRLAVMSRLVGGSGLLGGGQGLRWAGALAGFAAEAPAFTLVGRVARGQKVGDPDLAPELLSAYLVLGGMKSMGGVARQAALGFKDPRMVSSVGFVGMYGGLMLGHGAESAVGLRVWRPGGIEWAEGLAMSLQFMVSGRLIQQIGGARYAAMERNLEHHAERLIAANDGKYPGIQPAANGPHQLAEELTWRMASGGEEFGHAEAGTPTMTPGLRVLAAHHDPEAPTPPSGLGGLTIRQSTADAAMPAVKASPPTILHAFSEPFGPVSFRVFRSEDPLAPHEAVYAVKEISPESGSVTMEPDLSFHAWANKALPAIRIGLHEGLSVPARERFVFNPLYLEARSKKSQDVSMIRAGMPLEVPLGGNVSAGIGTAENLQAWYGAGPGARLLKVNVERIFNKSEAWFLHFEDLENPGHISQVMVKPEEASALGLVGPEGGVVDRPADLGIGLLERARQKTYAWGQQRAARLLPHQHGASAYELTLYLDDLAPMQDAAGKDSPFLILGRGKEGFGSEHFRDPSVGAEQIKLFFPNGYWMGDGGHIAAENLSELPVWHKNASGGVRPMLPRASGIEGDRADFARLMDGDKLYFGPYSIKVIFSRGHVKLAGEIKASSAAKSDAAEAPYRPVENLELAPDTVYEIGRNLRPTREGVVGLSIPLPFISLRHAKLLYQRPDPAMPGYLRVDLPAAEGEARSEPLEIRSEAGSVWKAPDLEGADRDLAMPESQIRSLLAPQVWTYRNENGKGAWSPMTPGSSQILQPGSLVAFGRLHKPLNVAEWFIKAGGETDLKMTNLPWDLRNAAVYQFSETPRGASLALYQFGED